MTLQSHQSFVAVLLLGMAMCTSAVVDEPVEESPALMPEETESSSQFLETKEEQHLQETAKEQSEHVHIDKTEKLDVRESSKCCLCNSNKFAWSGTGTCSVCAGQVEHEAPAPSGCIVGDQPFIGRDKCKAECRKWAKEYLDDLNTLLPPEHDIGHGASEADEEVQYDDVQDADIGVFARYVGTPGIGFLNGAPATMEDAQMIVDALNGSLDKSFELHDEAPLVSEASRQQLMHFVDEVVSAGERDVKRKMTLANLSTMIGDAAASKLLTLFHDDVHQIQVRRAEAHGDCINFHHDNSAKTLQVPLNNPDEYAGGQLAYITANGLEIPVRPAGCATIHDNTILHGVTRMQSGVRYGLFLQKLRS